MEHCLDKARRFRDLAEEVRAKAAMLTSREARDVLARLASDYDNLAESLELAVEQLPGPE